MSTSKPKSREPLDTRQRSILVSFYNENPYPSASERHQLVQITGRTLKQVQDWFSNRRRNDPKLISPMSTSTPSMTLQPIYYYPPAPPPMPTPCPCCYFTQTSSMIDQTIYPPCTTFYYPPPNAYHS